MNDLVCITNQIIKKNQFAVLTSGIAAAQLPNPVLHQVTFPKP